MEKKKEIILGYLHPWKVAYKEAVEIQNQLRSQLSFEPLKLPARRVGGVDVSYCVKSRRLFGGVVVMDMQRGEIIEAISQVGKETFPYIPGLLSFRELPIILEGLRKLRHWPEVFLVDGQGIAHPRGFGIASHLGVLLDLPTVGCAKSKLVGDYTRLVKKRGRYQYLYFNRKKVGAVVCTRDKVNPVYVSPGHRSDILSSIKLVLDCCKNFRIPEPLRCAHILSNKIRNQEISS